MTTHTPKVVASHILATKDGASNAAGGMTRQTREEYRKVKELDEARKAGTVPAEQDVDTGRDINPHIPQFIVESPWYASGGVMKGATLKHQRPHPERVEKAKLSEIHDWYARGTTGSVATKFRKGACGNCGAMTHKQKDCFERPRKIGAKYTGDDIAPDEHLQPKLKLWYDAKRDRWNGYNPEEHHKTIEEFQALEEARRMIKAEQQLQESKDSQSTAAKEGEGDAAAGSVDEKEGDGDKVVEKSKGEDSELTADAKPVADAEATVKPTSVTDTTPNAEDPTTDVDADNHDEDKYAEDADMPGVHVDNDSRTRITVRNLRIREDTAKYLYNLDPSSAYYDPKSRSMRENPFAGTNKEMEQVKFKGENFVRYTGEVTDVNKAQLFAWEAKRKGIDAHQLAEPTKLEQLKRELTVGKSTLKDQQKKAIIEQYGGEEHLKAPPKELLLAQTEAYVEYNRRGKVVKGEEKPVIRSKYPEDVYHNNHTAVWGSWWTDGAWGYACCHSCVKNSYCTGEAGKTQAGLIIPPTAKKSDKSADDDAVPSGSTAAATDSPSKKSKSGKSKSDEKSVDGKKKSVDASSSDSSSDSSDSDSSSGSSSSSSDSEDDEARKQLAEERRRAEERRTTKRNKRLRQKEARKQKGQDGKRSKKKKASDSDDSSDDDNEEPVVKKSKNDQDKLQEALKRIREAEREAEEQLRLGDRKRKYNARYEYSAPTDHDMEAYKLTKGHFDDPMANYMQEKRKDK